MSYAVRPVVVTIEGNENIPEEVARITDIVMRALNKEYSLTAPGMRRERHGVELYFNPHDVVGPENDVTDSFTKPHYEQVHHLRTQMGDDVVDMRPFSVKVVVND